ncbi:MULTISPECIES: DUF1289 domain-containing protein [unclassified Pseudoalteromonas]|uniref:DUF1289 domain-containing protein n=1 Tax=unclassified Pseudoalteromonas TaxID=194690 RepID=UPI000C06B6EA|nr:MULTISPECIES: DUF1289 domain-containing protein [unclassified Pseudoalteromonas]MDP2636069.1 DUF1289 domain-containing protein [Pseudoalteromonas sp. 1_MG-2023]PHN90612.1 DUF1289 domain-containing protein [Pseudoalteromonas sp. 3D05]
MVKRLLDEPGTPCVRRCCLDADDTCIGCFRTLEEILSWRGLSEAQKKQVMAECEVRKVKRKKCD